MRVSAFLLFSALTLSAAPQLRLSTTTIGPIYVAAGGNALPQSLNAYNVGDGSLNLTVTYASATWLSGLVGQAATCLNGPLLACLPVNITLNTSALPIGNYTEYLTVADPNAIDSPQNITVKLQVNGAPANADFYVTPNNGTALLTVNANSSVISTVKTSDNFSWLNFVLFGGNQVSFTSYQLKASAQPGQPEGTYSGSVILSGSNNAADDQTISVNLHVTSQPIIQAPAAPITINVVQGQSAQTSVNFGNAGLGSLSISGMTTSASWLSASLVSGTSVAITASPGSLSSGSYSGTVTPASNAANTSVPIPVRMNVAARSNPIAFPSGVVDNAAFAGGQAVAAGSIAAVFGSQLSVSSPANASGFPLPTTLGGVQVLMNGTAVPLVYADSGQVDFQVPFEMTTGQVIVQVTANGQPGNRVSAIVDSIAPRLFALQSLPAAPDGGVYGVVINNSDGTLALPSTLGVSAHPAHAGDLVIIYALGLGPVSPAVATGAAAPSSPPLALTVNPVQIMFGAGPGAVMATPVFAGLAPTYAGLYQLNLAIPPNVPTGNVAVTIVMPGHTSNLVEMAIASQ